MSEHNIANGSSSSSSSNNGERNEERQENVVDNTNLTSEQQESTENSTNNSTTNELAQKAKQKVLSMMEKMGYKEGIGLGKFNQGTSSMIIPDSQLGRTGLGFSSSSNNKEEKKDKNSSMELPSCFKSQSHMIDVTDISLKEEVKWISFNNLLNNDIFKIIKFNNEELLNNNNDKDYNNNIISSSSSIKGTNVLNFNLEKGMSIINLNMSTFTNINLANEILKIKSEFDELNDKLFIDARFRTNPYERIGKSIFQNRAAVKLANIDSLVDLTSNEGLPRIEGEDDVLYFADICAGPGGFTEYLYYRFKCEKAKGFGLTLKNEKDDWKLERFNKESPHDNFEICYGKDGTGDITKNENMKEFQKLIFNKTNNRGVALVTGDGGFCVEGVENSQEFLLQQLILCQVITGLLILRKGGTFVCKLFDLNTWFSTSIIYILYTQFEKTTIIKPFSSRPANSERYIVCKDLKEFQPSFILNYLLEINENLQNNQHLISSLVDINIMKNDLEFANYLTYSNESIAKNQLISLEHIKKGVEDKYLDLYETQMKVRDHCLQDWNLPNPQKNKSYNNNRRNDKRNYDNRNYSRNYNNKRYDNNYRKYDNSSSIRSYNNNNNNNNRGYDSYDNNRRYDNYDNNRSYNYDKRKRNDYDPNTRPYQQRNYGRGNDNNNYR
ncbi:hypothetical protein ABK040_000998 [Willaertia magna]